MIKQICKDSKTLTDSPILKTRSSFKQTLLAVITVLFLSVTLSTPVFSQDMEGFDPNAPSVPDFKLTPFYESNLEYIGKKPGDLLKKESIPAPEGAVAWRVMYVSRTWDDRLVPVTGIIAAPEGVSETPRPILNWVHGTTGGARICAPSLADDPAQNLVQRSDTTPIDYGVPYLTDFLARGFVVVATDYYGLGGPGVHQYLVGNTGARNGLDIARASREIKEINAGLNLLTFGWSVGGHAALFTGEEQPEYAPEFKLLGIAAIAPASTMGFQFVNIPHVYVMAASYNSAYNAPLTGFTDDGKKVIEVVNEVSITGVFKESLKYQGPFFEGDFDPVMKKALALNEAGQRITPCPILIVHGTADDVVNPELTLIYLPKSQKIGNTIKVSWYKDLNHRTVIAEARIEILQWFDDRLNGKPAPKE